MGMMAEVNKVLVDPRYRHIFSLIKGFRNGVA